MKKRTPGMGVKGHLLNTRNDGTLVFRVYDKSHEPFTWIDYDLTVDSLEVQIIQNSELIQTEDKTGFINDTSGTF